MKTNDIEKELGLTKHTIRYYEKEGFIHPHRDENGYRDYSEEDVQILRTVKFLRNLNISIDDVKAIVNNELNFQECLKVNKIHLEKHIEDLKEVNQAIDYYQKRDIPLIPTLSQIKIQPFKFSLGFQKTTNAVSLGRKLTRPLAIRRMIYSLLPSLFAGVIGMFIFEMVGIELSLMFKALIFICIALLIEMILIAANFQVSTVYLGDTIDHTMNQSVEFLSNGLRYYQFSGFVSNLKYFIAVICGKDKEFMYYYQYEDIDEVVIDVRKRYMKVGTPIAYEIYVPDFRFTFKDQQTFYFYWSLTLNDDMRYIATILEAKVKNIKDENHILYALKNGTNLNDYINEQ